jgi:molecular chaperone GrpE
MSEEPENPNGSGPNDMPLDEADMLRGEVAELKDRLLRALADVENIRRRSEREKTETSQYAIAKFARDVLAVADNFQRAIEACPPEARDSASPQVKAVIDGVEATERQLLATLERHGVKPIDTANAKFDPNLHQAIAEVPAEGKAKGIIVTTVQSGYTIGDRLLRPAMVTVSKGEAPSPGGGNIDTKV